MFCSVFVFNLKSKVIVYIVIVKNLENTEATNPRFKRNLKSPMFKLWRRLLRVIGKIDAEAEAPILWSPDAELTHWKRPSLGLFIGSWQRLKAGGEGGNRGRDG